MGTQLTHERPLFSEKTFVSSQLLCDVCSLASSCLLSALFLYITMCSRYSVPLAPSDTLSSPALHTAMNYTEITNQLRKKNATFSHD